MDSMELHPVLPLQRVAVASYHPPFLRFLQPHRLHCLPSALEVAKRPELDSSSCIGSPVDKGLGGSLQDLATASGSSSDGTKEGLSTLCDTAPLTKLSHLVMIPINEEEESKTLVGDYLQDSSQCCC